MSSPDLQALFANLKPRSQASTAVPTSPRETSGDIETTSPSISTPLPLSSPTNAATKMNENANPPAAQNLLNLLNFSSQRNQSSSNVNRLSPLPTSQQRSISASDLATRLMSPPNESAKQTEPRPGNGTPQSKTQKEEDAAANPLLSLLNRQTPLKENVRSDENQTPKSATLPIRSPAERGTSPMRFFGTAESRETTPFEGPEARVDQASPNPIFTYTNPFEALKASRSQTPRTLNTIAPENTKKDAGRPLAEIANDVNQSSLKEDVIESKVKNEDTETLEPTTESDIARAITQANDSPHLQNNHTKKTDDANAQNPLIPADEGQDMSGEWEDMPEASPKGENPRIVPVLTFPIKAFVSITLQLDKATASEIRDDGVLEISRLKKDFDQIDRSLAVATSKFITYAFVKHGGLRIIRQDDGKDKHVFKNTYDRIFNVSVCTTASNGPPSENQAVLGTGVSGAVYYAAISKDGNDLFENDELASESLIFPAFPQSDENTAGGILKTRARRSSCHPEYFAIGRGKFINLIWPAAAISKRYGVTETNRQVDIERFTRERGLQISTGKAGKDFVFSEDDTMIVSLDKTGRLRFWDIRKLTDEANTNVARTTPVVVDTPVLSLMTASPAERSWPTSVLFVDKARPYSKGGALRYVLVGLRQNHTLQLWDIALGKAVQELNFPHETEVDGICSVNYHPGSGIIVVGHPTRNSLFFIHLSAPRYTLSSSLTQAAYVQRVAAKDPDIPKPESTACMSGIRELSFNGRGQLRSVELLNVQKSTDKSKAVSDGQALFELYVVHSKGVTCLGINKDDLGWNKDNKVVQSVDSEKEGLISLKELKLGSVIEETMEDKPHAVEASQQSQNIKSSKKKSKKTKEPNSEVPGGPAESQSSIIPGMVADTAGNAEGDTELFDPQSSKDHKKTKKTKSQAVAQSIEQSAIEATQIDNTKTTRSLDSTLMSNDSTLISYASTLNSNGKPTTAEPKETSHPGKPESMSMSISGDWLDKELKKIEIAVTSGFKKEFDSLFQNIQEDRALQDQSSASRQEAVLRLVSSSLNTNVENSLSRILTTQMQEVAVPAVTESVTRELTDSITKNLAKSVPQVIEATLPSALRSVVNAAQIGNATADILSQKLNTTLQHQVTTAVREVLPPIVNDLLSTTVSTAVATSVSRLSAQLNQLHQENMHTKQTMEKMGQALESLATNLRTMSETQISFQEQILRDRQHQPVSSTLTADTTPRETTLQQVTRSPVYGTKVEAKTMTKEEIELREVTMLMERKQYEEGSIKWLQSSQPVKLFDELFVKFTPDYLSTDVSPLVAFSIAVTVANTLLTNTERRLEWISAAFDAVDFQDQEIIELSEHAPQLVGSIIQRLESLYMSIAESNNRDPLLQAIPPVAKKARDLRVTFQAVHRDGKN